MRTRASRSSASAWTPLQRWRSRAQQPSQQQLRGGHCCGARGPHSQPEAPVETRNGGSRGGEGGSVSRAPAYSRSRISRPPSLSHIQRRLQSATRAIRLLLRRPRGRMPLLQLNESLVRARRCGERHGCADAVAQERCRLFRGEAERSQRSNPARRVITVAVSPCVAEHCVPCGEDAVAEGEGLRRDDARRGRGGGRSAAARVADLPAQLQRAPLLRKGRAMTGGERGRVGRLRAIAGLVNCAAGGCVRRCAPCAATRKKASSAREGSDAH